MKYKHPVTISISIPLQKIKPPTVTDKRLNTLIHDLFIIRMIGSEPRFHSLLIIRMAGSGLLLR